jgi:hypothetical protein
MRALGPRLAAWTVFQALVAVTGLPHGGGGSDSRLPGGNRLGQLVPLARAVAGADGQAASRAVSCCERLAVSARNAPRAGACAPLAGSVSGAAACLPNAMGRRSRR